MDPQRLEPTCDDGRDVDQGTLRRVPCFFPAAAREAAAVRRSGLSAHAPQSVGAETTAARSGASTCGRARAAGAATGAGERSGYGDDDRDGANVTRQERPGSDGDGAGNPEKAGRAGALRGAAVTRQVDRATQRSCGGKQWISWLTASAVTRQEKKLRRRIDRGTDRDRWRRCHAPRRHATRTSPVWRRGHHHAD